FVKRNPEDEVKAWQFWHSRQHSVKQRILDADTKNSSGIIGQVEEITHNAIAIYWNPLGSPAKVNVAVQCLSTDFSSQKGVKGLPLHLQIDTFDDCREGVNPIHRGYCQIKVFCDKVSFNHCTTEVGKQMFLLDVVSFELCRYSEQVYYYSLVFLRVIKELFRILHHMCRLYRILHHIYRHYRILHHIQIIPYFTS
ncbi:protein grainyhead-like, partial [Tachypleus tridentatus]|uniref:protein grainyhead-like n=1 Tax=Tachypleus tridentatus TaxID=6853 RepID=UPI003FD67C30